MLAVDLSYTQVALVLGAVAVSARLLLHLYASSRKNARLPPGPKGTWIMGMTKEMLDQSIKPWIGFEQWSKEYNAPHLLSVPTLGQATIIVNSLQAANDLLEKRPKIYSGRPRNVFDVEIVEQNMVLANIDNPEEVAKRRKLLNEDVGAVGGKAMQPIQTEEARKFAADMLKRPKEYNDAIKQSQRSLVLRMTAHTTRTISPSQLWDHINLTQTRGKPSLVPLLQIWPSLRHLPSWIPGADFTAKGLQYHDDDKKIWLGLVEDCRQEMATGKAPNSFLARWLQTDAGKRYDLNETELAFAAGNLLTAGGDLPDITLRIFFLTMLHFPEVCAKAQAEIDALVGRERLPTFDDKDHCPYTRAMILEIQRWRPLSPIGVCHTSTEEDEYMGMHIPKGIRFFPSLYSMSKDPAAYPEPDLFKPERHLRPDGSFTKRNELPSWGFGGRKCSAMHLAEGTLFINIATLLWAFDFVAPVNEKGERVLPSKEYEDWEGVLPCTPPKFEVSATPRGPEVAALLNAEVDSYAE